MSNANKIARYITTIDSTPSYAVNVFVVKPMTVTATSFFFLHTLLIFLFKLFDKNVTIIPFRTIVHPIWDRCVMRIMLFELITQCGLYYHMLLLFCFNIIHSINDLHLITIGTIVFTIYHFPI